MWVANAKVGKSDYECASAGRCGNDEDAPETDLYDPFGRSRSPVPLVEPDI
jgi:hypothetical protein